MLHTLGPRHSRFGPLNRLLRTDRFVPGLLVVGAIVGAWASCARPAEAADASGPLQVATTTLEAREVYRVDRVYGGEVRARRSSTLGFRHSGVLRIVHVDEGDSVDAGTLLAELDPEPFQAALDQASAGVARAEAGLAEARAAAELATASGRKSRRFMRRMANSVANRAAPMGARKAAEIAAAIPQPTSVGQEWRSVPRVRRTPSATTEPKWISGP
jgi:multidrug efflux pump subunit AcrA (membrane-fusion protein)